jgi:hypothetical protein
VWLEGLGQLKLQWPHQDSNPLPRASSPKRCGLFEKHLKD